MAQRNTSTMLGPMSSAIPGLCGAIFNSDPRARRTSYGDITLAGSQPVAEDRTVMILHRDPTLSQHALVADVEPNGPPFETPIGAA